PSRMPRGGSPPPHPLSPQAGRGGKCAPHPRPLSPQAGRGGNRLTMTLATYRRKRRFQATPEPRGKRRRSAGGLRFVVQKHHATRLHYDFRLELDGTLKSWAVPKGPSLNPDDKRLAVMVEDHPLEYRTFEGVIPKGNYGAGSVVVWDQGTYEAAGAHGPEDNAALLRDGLARGRLSMVLHGQKLRGQFALVRLQRGKANEWLLLKK